VTYSKKNHLRSLNIMATYKKRGYKTKPIVEDTDVETVLEEPSVVDSATEEVFETLDETANKSEEWVAKNQKYIFTGVGVLVLILLAYIAYDRFVLQPKEIEASNLIYAAQKNYEKAETASIKERTTLLETALNGNDDAVGFTKIIEDYSGTQTAEVAKYYAGFSALELKDYSKAIEYLDDYNTDNAILNALAKGGVADAFSMLNEPQKALNYYQKALQETNNSFTSPKFLIKAAKTALSINETTKALNFLKQVENNYPETAKTKEFKTLLALVETKSL